MKNILIILLCTIFSTSYSQIATEKKIPSKISKVTVFLDNAQITRDINVDVNKGISILKFIKLSPFMDAKTIQVKAFGDFTVLSVKHEFNYMYKNEKKKNVLILEEKIKDIKDEIDLERTYIGIIKEELNFLRANKVIGGKNEQLNVNNLKETASFYSTKLKSLKLKEIERNNNLKKLMKSKTKLDLQLKTLTDKKEYPFSEVIVKIDAKKASKTKFELSYMVENAGWFPSYDIRAKNVNNPIEIVYKANIKQNTKVDWKNVKLSLSTANPNKSGVAPVLRTYYLNYNVLPPQYNLQTNTITGIVSDKQGPLPGVNVIVKGTTIGTSTDFDGKYSITIPNNANQLAFSYLGYETEFRNINNSIINVKMKESNAVLEEVVVTGYGKKKKNKSLLKALSGKVSGVSIRGASSTNLQLEQIEKQTSVNFDIKIPYTINSDNKKFSINMANYNIAADYTYYSVPKINQNAYLMAKITNWEKYNLLEGEANIFFENTFIGKSILDVRYGKDSLKISLGIDKNVYLKRENNVKYESKKFIGSRKEELRNWKITIKNNKKEPIKMVVYDQIPISTNDEIKVELLNSSSGKYNVENGEIEWKLLLKPFESKELLLKYFVKYPKNKNLIVE